MNDPVSQMPVTIPDLQTGMDYLAQLSLANPLVAERQLIRFLDGLLIAPPDPGILLALLEQARAPMCFVEEEMARRYHNKSLPLAGEEESFFQQVVIAWRKMGKAYGLCARMEEPEAGNPQYVSLVATILHRCLYYTGMVILEHYRARRELPAGIWLELHGYYESAETWGVAYTPVEDVLESNLQATHCAAAYTTLLLIDIASPYSNSVRNLNLIRRWANLWAPLVSIHRLDDDLELPPYIIELMKDAPLHPTPEVIDTPDVEVRRLDTARLGLQISHMLSQLRQRITPSQLGLGEETSGHVITLLEHLSRPWAQAASPRRFRRFPTEGIARVAVGFEAMHFWITGQAFEQPDSAATYSRGDFDQLFTFRDRADPGQTLAIRPVVSFPVDEWAVINHSANGFRLGRSNAGQKLLHGQLIALCPHDGEQFLLAQVSWLMQEDDGGLVAGVATLPGLPVGIGARVAIEGGASNERYVRAFLLPAVPAMRSEDSIVLPPGMYQASRVLEIFAGEETAWRLRMNHVVQRGSDFDRISYHAL
jgi:cyclic-di-GMP-binding protein